MHDKKKDERMITAFFFVIVGYHVAKDVKTIVDDEFSGKRTKQETM